jgi:SAM-dependent methyltransferase
MAVLLFVAGAAVGHNYPCIRSAPFHPNIHNLGNVGVGGMIHACLADLSTSAIDHIAYDGRNVRGELADVVRTAVKGGGRVYDVGCGVGTMTKALVNVAHFEEVHGVDTSIQMIERARSNVQDASFEVMNAVDLPRASCAVAVASFVFHELPQPARADLIDAMMSAATDEIWIMDIDLTYRPSPMMLSGEPYVTDYLANFISDIQQAASRNGASLSMYRIVRDHVQVWRLQMATTKGETPNGLDRDGSGDGRDGVVST